MNQNLIFCNFEKVKLLVIDIKVKKLLQFNMNIYESIFMAFFPKIHFIPS